MVETVPGSVARRYRNIRQVSAAELIQHFDSNWYIEFKKSSITGASEGIVLTVTGGSAMPDQSVVTTQGASNSRGTFIVTRAKSALLTGKYAREFLQTTSDAHDIAILSNEFEYHRLIPVMASCFTPCLLNLRCAPVCVKLGF